MQWQCAGGLPHVFANAFQLQLFLIELVLNLADEFFDHILERRDADRAAVFIHHNCKMQFPFKKQPEQFFQPPGFGDVNQFARHRQQIRRGPRLVAQCIKVFDVDNAARLVQIAAFAKRKARVARLFRNGETLGNRRLGVESDDFVAWSHDFTHDTMAQVERIKNDVASIRRSLR